ncbi:uncharacterized protein LOC122644719 [Telopea speciosissima]|uniref:uncharacterized protein LOC122644719 n=1 Tax=Telopea speciosissima TaxID=54955 RepID=UPI001CC4DDBC|nr:uncharacterized protein LOC122644719 [Telopea speciosissima]
MATEGSSEEVPWRRAQRDIHDANLEVEKNSNPITTPGGTPILRRVCNSLSNNREDEDEVAKGVSGNGGSPTQIEMPLPPLAPSSNQVLKRNRVGSTQEGGRLEVVLSPVSITSCDNGRTTVTEHEDFRRFVQSSWAAPIRGSPLFVVTSKLKRLKGPIREWARGFFPHIDQEARKDYDKAVLLQEKLWSEKARDKWVKRTRNLIREIKKEDRSVLTDPSAIGNHFENIFKRGVSIKNADLILVIPPLVMDVDNAMLAKIPSQEEIRAAVFDLDPTSAPDPDGFLGAFFRVCWDIVGIDVCRGIQNFFREGVVTKGINCAFLSLVPKIENANKVGQFRPICLGNFVFKLIPKIMATHLSSILHKLISAEQEVSQKGKMIFENIGVASELTGLMATKCRGGGLGMKLNTQKTFDTLEWGYLFDVLKAFGFSNLWISWVHQILLTTRISVLINGGPVGFLGVERELRQGDLLSPLLFILSEEVLCRGLSALRNSDIRSVKRIKYFLEAYGGYSGQIPFCTFPTRYLGLELMKGRVKSEAILPLVDQFKKRLSTGKGLLSMARRVELVRSVMSSVPIHNFSVYLWLASTIGTMERWIQNFIWSVWDIVQSAERWAVRDGATIRFWYDKWIGDQCIEDILQPFQIPRNLTAIVSDFLEGESWVFPQVTNPALHEVLSNIQDMGIAVSGVADTRFWAHTKSGLFSVQSA